MKKKIVSITVLLHFTALVHGAAFPGGGALAEIPSLKLRAFQAMIPHPGVLVQKFDMIGYNPDLQSQLFVESVNGALRSRLGFSVLASNPDMPLKTIVFEGEEFKGFSPDEQLIALHAINPDTRQIDSRIVSLQTREQVRIFAGEEFQGFSPDGQLIALHATNPNTRQIDSRIVSLQTGKPVRIFAGEEFKGFSPDSKLVALLNFNQGYAHLVKLETGETERKFKDATFLELSPDGGSVAGYLANFETREYDVHIVNLQSGSSERIFEKVKFKGFSPDSKVVALEGLQQKKLRLVDLQSNSPERIFENVEFMGFSPDGRFVAVEGRNKDTKRYGVRIVNLKTNETVHVFDDKLFLGFSPDGILILLEDVVLGEDGEMLPFAAIVNLRTGDTVRIFPREGFKDFSRPGGKWLATQSGPRTVLRQIVFNLDLVKIADIEQQKFLLNAAQAWFEKKAYRVDANNAVYKAVIKLIPYLNDSLLFETLQDIYTRLRADLAECAARVSDINDPQLKDLSSRTYKAWSDLQKSLDAQKDENTIFNDYLETFKLRSPAQRMPQVPISSSQAGTLEPVVGSSHDGVRAPDEPQTMRLFE